MKLRKTWVIGGITALVLGGAGIAVAAIPVRR
jgi:hypothetical protein